MIEPAVRLCLAATFAPVALFADGIDDPLTFEVTHLVAATTVVDWNGDDVADRLVLVRNKAGDAVDMFLYLSNAQGDAFATLDLFPAILPAAPLPEETLHSISRNIVREGEPPRPTLNAFGGELSLSLGLALTDQGWQAETLRSYYSAQGAANSITCYFDYRTGRARLERPRVDTQFIEIGPAPELAPYWWQSALPSECVR